MSPCSPCMRGAPDALVARAFWNVRDAKHCFVCRHAPYLGVQVYMAGACRETRPHGQADRARAASGAALLPTCELV